MPGFDDELCRGSAVVTPTSKSREITLVFYSKNLINHRWLIWLMCLRAKLKSYIQRKHGGDEKKKCKKYLESEGDIGHEVLHDVAGCVHGQLVRHVPVVIIHPAPVLNLGKQRV